MLTKKLNSVPREVLILSAIAASLLGFFLKLTSELREGELDAFDQAVMPWAVSLRHDSWNGPMVDLTALGSATVVGIICAFALIAFLFLGDRRGAVALFLGSLALSPITHFTKALISRPRPEGARLVEVTGYSYPSGHSLTAAAFYCLLLLMVIRHFPSLLARGLLLALGLLVVVGVGFSRVYLGVHYPSDVASGILFGTSWACLVTTAVSFWKPKARRA